MKKLETDDSGLLKKSVKKNHVDSHLFSDEYKYDGDYEIETTLLLTQYNREVLDWKELTVETPSFSEFIRQDCMNWLQITGLKDAGLIRRILQEFDIQELDAKAVMTPCHAAKIDNVNGRLFIVTRPCFFESKDIISDEHICIIAKGNIVLTFRERGMVSFDNVMKALRMDIMDIRKQNRGILVAFILNAILSVLIGMAIKVEEMLEYIDDVLLDPSISNVMIGRKIQQCSHANLILQKNSVPLKGEFNKLLATDLVQNDPLILSTYNELYNQLDYILLTAENSKELLASMRDLYVSNNDFRTNTIMKRLTVVSTLFIPITFLVGLWGMNFSLMPEIQWRYGYILAWIILITTGMVTWHYMRKNKWF